MITIANPIYDVVFKYLMEDERIARTILSALLRKDITHVEMRPHEYIDEKIDGITVQRIDFGATVREEGVERLILIELQKTWLPTELLRFRQYLARQYRDTKNMALGNRHEYALPMVMVYLLGHRVGDIKEPVLYVKHDVYDREGRVVTEGIPDPFIESLTHESIIVQIPLLRGQVNTRLDCILSLFDQSYKDSSDAKLLHIDENAYDADDADMQRILLRLTGAAADEKFRKRMDLEDEIFAEIKSRNVEILERDRKLAEQKSQIDEQKSQIDEQKSQIDEQKSQIDEQKSQIDEQKSQIDEQKSQIDEQKSQIDEQKSQIDEQKSQIDEQKSQIDEQKSQIDEQKSQIDEQKSQIDEQKSQIDEQKSQIEQKDALIRCSVQLFAEMGMSHEAIAAKLGITADDVRKLLA